MIGEHKSLTLGANCVSSDPGRGESALRILPWPHHLRAAPKHGGPKPCVFPLLLRLWDAVTAGRRLSKDSSP